MYPDMSPGKRAIGAMAALALTSCLNVDTQELRLATVAISVGDPNCPNGGQLIQSGVDENDDGTLEEVQSEVRVCFPNPPAATSTTPTGMGASPEIQFTTSSNGTCTQLVTAEVGVDVDGDGSISMDERNSSSVCVQDDAERFIDSVFSQPLQLMVSSTLEPNGVTQFSSLPDALAYLRDRRKSGPVSIELASETWTMESFIRLDDLDGVQLEIVGPRTGSQPILNFGGDGFVVPSGFALGALRRLSIRNTGANCTDADSCTGVRINQGGKITLDNVDVQDFRVGVHAVSAVVTMDPTTATDESAMSGVNITCRSGLGFSVGLWVQFGAEAVLPGASVSNCTHGFFMENNSTAVLNSASASSNDWGFRAESGSFVRANGATSSGNRGANFIAISNSTIVALEWAGGDANGAVEDLVIRDSSVFRASEFGFPSNRDCGNVECDDSAQIRGCSPNPPCTDAAL